jgi:DNA excision repair protein ERCC-4
MNDADDFPTGEPVGEDSRERILIDADDRERCPELLDALRQRDDVSLRIRRLSQGDYLVDGSLLVERKTIRDFALSTIQGRLFAQVYRLVRSAGRRTCLILEGGGTELREVGMSRESLQGALTTVTLVLGMPVLRSLSPAETASLMVTAGRQLRARSVDLPERYGHKPKSLERIRLLLLQSIPGVGVTRAKALLERFSTPMGVCAATRDELAQVAGVGTATAGRLWEVLHGKPAA